MPSSAWSMASSSSLTCIASSIRAAKDSGVSPSWAYIAGSTAVVIFARSGMYGSNPVTPTDRPHGIDNVTGSALRRKRSRQTQRLRQFLPIRKHEQGVACTGRNDRYNGNSVFQGEARIPITPAELDEIALFVWLGRIDVSARKDGDIPARSEGCVGGFLTGRTATQFLDDVPEADCPSNLVGQIGDVCTNADFIHGAAERYDVEVGDAAVPVVAHEQGRPVGNGAST
jgi:hypothetical protein